MFSSYQMVEAISSMLDGHTKEDIALPEPRIATDVGANKVPM